MPTVLHQNHSDSDSLHPFIEDLLQTELKLIVDLMQTLF